MPYNQTSPEQQRCNWHPLEVPSELSPESLTLLAHIPPELIDIDDAVAAYANRNGFERKDEAHITLIGFGLGKRLLEAMEQLTDTAKNEGLELIESLNGRLSSFCFNEDYYHISKPGSNRESIIQTVDVPGITDYFDELRDISGIEPGQPFPHITHYTKGDLDQRFRGIGIQNVDEFNALTTESINVDSFDSFEQ